MYMNNFYRMQHVIKANNFVDISRREEVFTGWNDPLVMTLAGDLGSSVAHKEENV